MVGGPLGALVGAAVGHNFDQGAWKADGAADATGHQERVQRAFLATAFQLMGYIAKADGRVSEAEIAVARAIMDRLRLNAGQRRVAIDHFTEGKQPDFAVSATLDTFQRICSGHFALVQQMLEMQLNVAYADGNSHPQAYARLLSITERLGIPRLQFEALHDSFRAQLLRSRQRSQSGRDGAGDGQSRHRQTYESRPTTAVNSLEQAYAVLGLGRNANPAEIKLAYRRLLKQHHPDKLASSNASPAAIKRATEKTREITAAYERIRETLGF